MAKVAGSVFNPTKKKFQAVVGDEFPDSPGYYQFYAICSNEHFRKTPGQEDIVSYIQDEVFLAFYDLTGGSND